MGWFKRLFGGPAGVHETIRESYDEHRRTSQSADPHTAHARGLYGALERWYLDEHAPRPEIQIWTELVPFLLLDEAEGVEALAELLVLHDMPLEARSAWLGERVRWAIRERLPDATDFLRGAAARALRQGYRPWLAFITEVEREVIRSSEPG